jgi:hypothetical protein
MMARLRRIEKMKEIGGVRIAQNRVPAWLLFVIVAIISWGLYYLITYTVTDTGTFQAPAALLRL